jgi:hypothetical protein
MAHSDRRRAKSGKTLGASLRFEFGRGNFGTTIGGSPDCPYPAVLDLVKKLTR